VLCQETRVVFSTVGVDKKWWGRYSYLPKPGQVPTCRDPTMNLKVCFLT